MMKCMMVIFSMVLMCGIALAEICVPFESKVSFTCNGGTVKRTLLNPQWIHYGVEEFFPLRNDMDYYCEPPAGHIYAGNAIIVDGVEVAHGRLAGGVDFMYTSEDVVVGPHWVSVAKPETLAVNFRTPSKAFDYDTANAKWSVNFDYGVVSGVAKCSSVLLPDSHSGNIVSDQAAIENSVHGSGGYCYCKMTQPYISSSPWVSKGGSTSSANCMSGCTYDCASGFTGNYDSSIRFRASIFAGAVLE